MRAFAIPGILAVFVLLSGCSRTEERFIAAYRDILIVREMYPDTAVANPKVREILKQYGFTKEEFREIYFEMAKNPRRFQAILDSLRLYAREYVQTHRKSSH